MKNATKYVVVLYYQPRYFEQNINKHHGRILILYTFVKTELLKPSNQK